MVNHRPHKKQKIRPPLQQPRYGPNLCSSAQLMHQFQSNRDIVVGSTTAEAQPEAEVQIAL